MQLEGAKKALENFGAQSDGITVRGALAMPPTIALAAKAAEGAGKSYDGYVALGCVIRGETYHFEIVANESARGLMELGLHHGLCIGNGILTVENEEQALVRAASDGSDKGGDAARACIALIETRNKLGVHR
jgi:6,7-dimethyl-8-ribityllumazine synthase